MASFLSSARKYFLVHFVDPLTNENKYHFADTFELAYNRTELILKDYAPETPLKIRIFEEIATFTRQQREPLEPFFKSQSQNLSTKPKTKKKKEGYGLTKDIKGFGLSY